MVYSPEMLSRCANMPVDTTPVRVSSRHEQIKLIIENLDEQFLSYRGLVVE